jgi:hypothetical protein
VELVDLVMSRTILAGSKSHLNNCFGVIKIANASMQAGY